MPLLNFVSGCSYIRFMYMYIVSRELGLCTVLNEHNVILVVQVLKSKKYTLIYSELRPFLVSNQYFLRKNRTS